MSDIQVTTARRVVFTAMAVVVFWVVSWNAYVLGWYQGPWGPEMYLPIPSENRLTEELRVHWYLTAPCLAIGPVLFLSIAVDRNPFRRPTCWMLWSTTLLVASIAFVFHVGENVATRTSDAAYPIVGTIDEAYEVVRSSFVEHAPWTTLLSPIILTTAFVIYGAWRRAVRDAEAATGGVEVSEDE